MVGSDISVMVMSDKKLHGVNDIRFYAESNFIKAALSDGSGGFVESTRIPPRDLCADRP